jgi:hypothetical protein
MSLRKLAFSTLRTVSLTSLVSGAALAALSTTGCAEQNQNPSMSGEKGCGGEGKCGGEKKCGGDKKAEEKKAGAAKAGGEKKCGGEMKCGGDKKK